jgi:hypothetical protein
MTSKEEAVIMNPTHTLTIVRGEQPNSVGEDLVSSGIKIPSDDVYEWLESNGVVVEDPDVWVLVTPIDVHPGELRNVIARRDVEAQS